MPLASGVLAGRAELAATARLLHGFGFKPVELDNPRLSYEPRWSCQCNKEACAAVWVASKSGAVMRIDLARVRSNGRPMQRWFPGNREARTIYHQHDGAALGGGSFLLIGRDDGALDIISDDHPGWAEQPPPLCSHGQLGSFHLESWWERGGELAVGQGMERTPNVSGRYTMGITAIAVLARPDDRDTVDLLAATRYPWLYVIEVSRGRMHLQHRIPMPGWIQWIIGPQPGDSRVTCVSRGGDIVRFSVDELRRGGDGQPNRLSILPTSAMPFGSGSLLLGATNGLFLVSEGRPEGIAVPVTRSPVLCLDRAVLENDENDASRHEYITMGLEDGRLRVVDALLLRALANGCERPRDHDHNFAIELGDAVLAVETLRLEAGPRDGVYVLAVLRDHSVRLFHVTGQQTQRRQVAVLWDSHVRSFAATSADDPAARFAVELRAAREPPPDCDRNAWSYMLVDVVLPRLRALASDDRELQRELVALASEMAVGADHLVLHRLSTALGQLAGGDVGLLLDLSRSVLAAVPHGSDRRWWRLIDSHLRELSSLAATARDGARARLVAWTRFVRKYVLLGNTFAAKQVGLCDLVEQNHETHKYFDALIYQARLSQRRYDLRWEQRLDADVSALHSVDCGPSRTIVVVVTVDGKLAFFDGSTGRRWRMRVGGDVFDVLTPFLTPFAGSGHVRTLASAVVRDGGRFRVVASCTGADVPPAGLVVVDVQWWAGNTHGDELIARISMVVCGDPEARVHALQPLPGHAEAFVAGLETRASPVGLLRRTGAQWVLELAKDDARTDSTAAHSAPTPTERFVDPGKMPTRALAVAAVDDANARYLAVTGSDDGRVRAISFAWREPAGDWKVRRWDRVADAVTSVVLGGYARSHATAGHTDRGFGSALDDSLSCYLGTAAGEVIALSILPHDWAGAGTTVLRFGDFDAQPLWRETHDGAVLALRLWRTPLFDSDEVLMIGLEKGRLCAYKHSYPEKGRVSAESNFYFRGMRFERVTLPDRLCALTMIDRTDEFVAAGPGGRLYAGRLVYLRESVDRKDPEQRGPGADLADGGLPREMWARLHHLLAASSLDQPFGLDATGPDARDKLKLELCDLVQLEGGALSSYVLRERLEFHDPWRARSAAQVRANADRLLRPLDPEKPADAERIKIILKSLCRAFLYRNPFTLKDELVAHAAIPDHAGTAAACEFVAEYLTQDLAHATSAAARLRIVGIKELLRVSVLRHMAVDDEDGKTIRAAVASALDSCLRDDDRLVRIEALRALSMALRNVGILADASEPADRKLFLAALFPRGLGSLEWLLELLVGGLQRFPNFTRHTALVSGAWYHISPLLPLFRIFPDRTLALCDYLMRAELSVEILVVCVRSLRRQRADALWRRIENLYVIPLEKQHARVDYTERYARNGAEHQTLWNEIGLELRAATEAARDGRKHEWHQIDDAAMAYRITHLHDQLARMWSVKRRSQMAMFHAEPSARDAPLAALEGIVAELASVANDLTKPNAGHVRALEHLEELGKRHGSDIEGRSTPSAPLSTIVLGIVAAWREVYNPPLADKGMRIGKYKLGVRKAEGGFGTLFELDEPADLQKGYVIKVLRRLKSPNAAKRFLEGADFNQRLWKESVDRSYIVEVTEIHRERPYLAYVMPTHRVLEDSLKARLHTTPERLPWAERAAEHIARALRAAHVLGRCHGDVKASNILVDFEITRGRPDYERPIFRLGDFDLAYAFDDTVDSPVGPLGIVPEWLSQKVPHDGSALERRQWDDIAGLALILYRMLTGNIIDPRAPARPDLLDPLEQLARNKVHMERRRALPLIETLRSVFAGKHAFDIHEFLRKVRSEDDVQGATPKPLTAGVASGQADRMPSFTNGRALIIGVAGYQTISALPAAVREDAAGLATMLRSPRCGYPDARVTSLIDAQATREAIVDALDELGRVAVQEDTVVVYFSGHGAPDPGRVDSYLLAHDTDLGKLALTGISSAVFTEKLAAIKSGRLIVLLDACHAGGAADLKAATGSAPLASVFDPAKLATIAEGEGRVILSSCKASEVSLVLEGDKNSLFTKYLLRGLDGEAAVAGVVTLGRLFDYVATKVQSDATAIGRVQTVVHDAKKASLMVLASAASNAPSPARTPAVPSVRRLRERIVDGFGDRNTLDLLCADVQDMIHATGYREAGRPLILSIDAVGGREKPIENVAQLLIERLQMRGLLGHLILAIDERRPAGGPE